MSDPIQIGRRTDVTRRDALKLIAGGIAALEAGCLRRAGDEDSVPRVTEAPEQRPGALVEYASALSLDGYGTGVIVATRDGRPIKLDGNPAHPASLGGSTAQLQARILELYDPQRSQAPRLGGRIVGAAEVLARLRSLPPGPVWLVLPPQSSPVIAPLVERLRELHELHVVEHAPLGRRRVHDGHALLHGRRLEHQPGLSSAGTVAVLDGDPLAAGPMAPAWARDVAERRAPGSGMLRLWAAGPVPTATSSLADEWIPMQAGEVVALAASVLAVAAPGTLPDALVARAHAILGPRRARADVLARGLQRGRGVVLAGERQPPVVHALARSIDTACGNPGVLTAPALLELGTTTVRALVAALRARQVGTLIVIDTDIVHAVPALATLAASAPLSLHVGLFVDATARACAAHLPLAHELETWSAPRAYDGTLAIGQPALRPRFPVTALLDVLAVLAGDLRTPRGLVRDAIAGSDAAWTDALRAGVVPGTAAPALAVDTTWTETASAALALALAPPPAGTIEIALSGSPALHDGRFAANAWLQELPHPVTKQAWGNAALLAADTAKVLGVDDGDLLTLATEHGTVAAPALVVPGAADGTITLELGYGCVCAEQPIADGVGVDAAPLHDGDVLVLRGTAVATGGVARVIRTQHETSTQGHELAPVLTLATLRTQPDPLADLRGELPSLLPAPARDGVQWGMSIDTSVCTGCNACVIACQAENNIATVGPDEVARGRQMAWLRIDRYVDAGLVVNEPMACQHCENAPCEYVCPVGATTHSPDGLNEQTYNRCIGTRFCANNCPYKVRRFNWFANDAATTRALQHNPDVTVRSRGVMEKCTYCVQRIRRADHAALVEHRAVRPGEVVTACQQACPTGAIQFGMLGERDTPFARMRRDRRRFEVLHDLGTRPRTQYLAKVRNPEDGT